MSKYSEKIDTNILNPKRACGWAKHAFVIAFFYLQKGTVHYSEVLY